MTSRAGAAGLLLVALGGCLGAEKGSREIDGGADGDLDAGPPLECDEASDCTFGEEPGCSCGRCTHLDFECDVAGRRYTAATGGGGACVPAPIQIDSGYQHTCVAWSNGRASCWGTDCNGELGDLDEVVTCDPEQTPERSLVPTPVLDQEGAPFEGVVRIATTYASTCALREDGTVWCWGGNGSGQLGNGQAGSRPRPVQVIDTDGLPLDGIDSIAAGGHHMCALDAGRRVWCWGANSHGQLGVSDWTGDPTDARDRAHLAAGMSYTAIAAGGAHTCAIAVNVDLVAELWCFGRNNLGQLGYQVDGADSPVAVKVLRESDQTPLSALQQVGLGNNFTCAGTFPSSLWCWGQNAHHALGDQEEPAGVDGTTAWMARPSARDPSVGVAQVAAGDDFACARLGTGDVHCWGGNGNGQIGTGSEEAHEPPSLVLEGAEALAVGFAEACVITSDRRVLCWGANDNGQLGDGTETSRDVPTEVRELCP